MNFPREEYQRRWSGLQAEMKERDYTTAVFWQRTGGSFDGAGDVYYLTNYASHSSGQELWHGGAGFLGRGLAAVVVQLGREPELHTAEPASVVDRDTVFCGEVFGHEADLAHGLAGRLAELGVEGRIASASEAFLSAELYRQVLAATPGIEWVPEHDLLYRVQHNKSARELEVFREAGEISSRALGALMDGLLRGDRECDAVARAAEIIIRSGGGFQRVACHHGPKSEHAMWSDPLYGYTTESPAPGDIVRGWVYGPIRAGYWIDPGRTSVCGRKPSAEQRKLLEDTVAIVEGLVDAHRPGVTARELGLVGDRLIAERGYGAELGGAIWDLYGHGLSTFWTPPKLPALGNISEVRRRGWHVDEPFHVGQVCTVEIFMQQPGVGTATFEQVLIVQQGEAELLTTTPLLFW